MLAMLLACAGDKGEPAPPGDTAASTELTAWASVLGAPADALGNAARDAGDLDGDGKDDLLVAAYLGNRVCALFGPLAVGSAALDARSPACLSGELDTDYAGYGVTAAPDLSGDGLPDLVVGSIGNSETGANAGKVYLVAGPIAAGSTTLDLAADAAWLGETAGDYAGVSLESAADLTGDGAADLLIGASGYDGEGGGGGRAYVVSGPISGTRQGLADAAVSITGLGAPALPVDTGDTGVPVPPPHGAFGTGDFVGDAMAGDRDLDGDGLADLALGASGDQTAGSNAGKVAVFLGPVAAGAWSVTDADMTLYGSTEGAYAGSPLRGVPDLDGDGLDDLLVSADALGAGQVYLVSPTLPEDSVSGASRLRFEGVATGDLFGYALSSAMDVDGDGAADLAISAPWAEIGGEETGGVWLFHGPFEAGVVEAGSARAVYGAVEGDTFGSAVEFVANLGGEAGPDLVIGARNDRVGGGFAGAVYLFDVGG